MMIEVITGPMYSGKSDELIRRLTRAHIGKKKVLAVKPEIDNRYSDFEIVSHAGAKIAAQPISKGDICLLERISNYFDVIGIDEAQFCSDEIVFQAQAMSSNGKLVIIAGLDMTCFLTPFGPMGSLLAVADRVQKLTAVCHRCGEEASLTQRVIDGKVAHFDSDKEILVGGMESYEARCHDCFERPLSA